MTTKKEDREKEIAEVKKLYDKYIKILPIQTEIVASAKKNNTHTKQAIDTMESSIFFSRTILKQLEQDINIMIFSHNKMIELESKQN